MNCDAANLTIDYLPSVIAPERRVFHHVLSLNDKRAHCREISNTSEHCCKQTILLQNGSIFRSVQTLTAPEYMLVQPQRSVTSLIIHALYA